MPVVRVGSTTGAKYGEWFPGSESRRPSAIALSTVWVSRPPQNQKTVGTPAASPKLPTSSLAVTSGMGIRRSSPKCALNAAMVASVAAGSLISSGALLIQVISGGRGAPLAVASAVTMRSTAARTRSRVGRE